MSIIHNTFVIEHAYHGTPERVFAAFADPAKKRRWFAEAHHHDVETFEMDFRVGGIETARYKMNATTPFPGVELSSTGVFHVIVPNQRIVSSATMSLGGNTISVALATFELVPAANGTDLVFTHQAAFFEGADGPQMREQGWRAIFDRLAAHLAA